VSTKSPPHPYFGEDAQTDVLVPPDPETITILDQHRELEKMGHSRSGGGRWGD